VRDGAQLVGVVAVSHRRSLWVTDHLWLWGLYVRPRYRGTPVSRRLMEAALAWCERQPHEARLFAAFGLDNAKAWRCFSRWSFWPPAEPAAGLGELEMRPGDLLVERERDALTAPPCAG
jgi:GNAT superfamily N-acetyltransferase